VCVACLKCGRAEDGETGVELLRVGVEPLRVGVELLDVEI
jgi:hypothetical protein